MSRPHPAPPADHEQHDTLLIAQYAANDPLDEAQRHDAAALVSACSDCASLVADLRAVSGAVAWEPVPPRRRDFRLSASQAEAARGSRVQRFMHRLALPQSTALRPMAAGVMSLGLLMVVAGTVWPDGATMVSDSVPAAVMAPAPTGAPAAAPAPTLEDAQAPEFAAPPDANARSDDAVGDAAEALRSTFLELQSPSTREGFAADGLRANEQGLGAAVEESAVAGSKPAAADVERMAEPESDAARKRAKSVAPAEIEAGATAAEGQVRASPAVGGDGAFADLEGAALDAIDLDADERQQRAGRLEAAAISSPDTTAASDTVTGEVAQDAALEAVADEGVAFETVLLIAGVLLAIAGLLSLLLIWFARRSSDPLVR